jgi:hypothetical protein
VTTDKDAIIADLKDIIREALTVLHKTNVRKKDTADRMRKALGMLPGERVRAKKK